MFGYITVNKQELKIREYDLYKSYYCGLCRELREKYGLKGQISLTYDLTFAVLLLTGLYEPGTLAGKTNCVIHPVVKQSVRKNAITEYAADMNILLTYYKCLDDWTDEKKIYKLGYAKTLKRSVKKLEKKYPEKSAALKILLDAQNQIESENRKNIDEVSGISGQIMAEILAYRQDEWEGSLRKIGMFLGKFIYIMDAYEDIYEDIKKNNYNIFREEYTQTDFDIHVKKLLLMMMSEACREFECLPVIKHAEILRNILYSGVWSKYEALRAQRETEQEN